MKGKKSKSNTSDKPSEMAGKRKRRKLSAREDENNGWKIYIAWYASLHAQLVLLDPSSVESSGWLCVDTDWVWLNASKALSTQYRCNQYHVDSDSHWTSAAKRSIEFKRRGKWKVLDVHERRFKILVSRCARPRAIDYSDNTTLLLTLSLISIRVTISSRWDTTPRHHDFANPSTPNGWSGLLLWPVVAERPG